MAQVNLSNRAGPPQPPPANAAQLHNVQVQQIFVKEAAKAVEADLLTDHERSCLSVEQQDALKRVRRITSQARLRKEQTMQEEGGNKSEYWKATPEGWNVEEMDNHGRIVNERGQAISPITGQPVDYTPPILAPANPWERCADSLLSYGAFTDDRLYTWRRPRRDEISKILTRGWDIHFSKPESCLVNGNITVNHTPWEKATEDLLYPPKENYNWRTNAPTPMYYRELGTEYNFHAIMAPHASRAHLFPGSVKHDTTVWPTGELKIRWQAYLDCVAFGFFPPWLPSIPEALEQYGGAWVYRGTNTIGGKVINMQGKDIVHGKLSHTAALTLQSDAWRTCTIVEKSAGTHVACWLPAKELPAGITPYLLAPRSRFITRDADDF